MATINWDEQAAMAAIRELERAAGDLRDSSKERQAAAKRATEEWRGRHRMTFDEHIHKASREAEDIADDFMAIAAEIRRLNERAREERAKAAG